MSFFSQCITPFSLLCTEADRNAESKCSRLSMRNCASQLSKRKRCSASYRANDDELKTPNWTWSSSNTQTADRLFCQVVSLCLWSASLHCLSAFVSLHLSVSVCLLLRVCLCLPASVLLLTKYVDTKFRNAFACLRVYRTRSALHSSFLSLAAWSAYLRPRILLQSTSLVHLMKRILFLWQLHQFLQTPPAIFPSPFPSLLPPNTHTPSGLFISTQSLNGRRGRRTL